MEGLVFQQVILNLMRTKVIQMMIAIIFLLPQCITFQDVGSSLDFSVSYSHDVDTANFSIARSISPSSTGEINEHDTIDLSLSRQLSETLTASISSSYQETRSAFDNLSDNRKYFSVTPSLNKL